MSTDFELESRTNFHQVIRVCLAGLLGALFQVLNFYFFAKITSDHLTAASMLTHLWKPFMLIGWTHGWAVMFFGKKDSDPTKVVNEAFSLALGASVITLLLVLYVSPLWLNQAKVGSLAGVQFGAYIQIATGLCLGLNGLGNFCLISVGQSKLRIRRDTIGILLLVAGDGLTLLLLTDPGHQFIGMCTTALLVQFYSLSQVFKYFRSSFRPSFSLAVYFFKKSKAIIASEGVSYIFTNIAISAASVLLLNLSDKEAVAAYNVTQGWTNFVNQAYLAIASTGVTWLVSAANQSAESDWNKVLKAIRTFEIKLSIVPVICIMLITPFIFPYGYNLNSRNSIIMAVCLLARFLFNTNNTPVLCQLRALHKNHWLMATQITTGLVIPLPIVWYFTSRNDAISVAIYGFFMPEVVRAIIFYNLKERISPLRRVQFRHVTTFRDNLSALVTKVNDRSALLQFDLLDISLGGCSLSAGKNEVQKGTFDVNSLISGRLIFNGTEVPFEGELRGVYSISSYFSLKRKKKYGIKFTNITPEKKSQIEGIIASLNQDSQLSLAS